MLLQIATSIFKNGSTTLVFMVPPALESCPLLNIGWLSGVITTSTDFAMQGAREC
jgi:hypothetical protein